MDWVLYTVLLERKWVRELPHEVTEGLSEYLVELWDHAGRRQLLGDFATARTRALKRWVGHRAESLAAEAERDRNVHRAKAATWEMVMDTLPGAPQRYNARLHARFHAQEREAAERRLRVLRRVVRAYGPRDDGGVVDGPAAVETVGGLVGAGAR